MQSGLLTAASGSRIKQDIADIDILSKIDKAYAADLIENIKVSAAVFIQNKADLSDGIHS